MAEVNVTAVSYFLPIISFLLVWILVYAVLAKTEVIKSQWLQIFSSLLVATLFITAVGARDYIKYVGAWMAMLIVSMIFLLMILGMFGRDLTKFTNGAGISFAIVALLIFIVSAIVVYSSYIGPYLPWGDGVGNSSGPGQFAGWLYSSRVLGAVLLLVVSGIVAFILAKSKGK